MDAGANHVNVKVEDGPKYAGQNSLDARLDAGANHVNVKVEDGPKYAGQNSLDARLDAGANHVKPNNHKEFKSMDTITP